MGQALSSIISCLCGEAEDEEISPRKIHLQISCTSLESQCNSTSNGALIQTPRTYSPSLDSCSDSSRSGISVHPYSDSDSDSDSHGGFQQQVPNSSPSFVPLSDFTTNYSLNPTIVVASDVEVVEGKAQVNIPILSELTTKDSRKEEEEEEEEEEKAVVVEENVRKVGLVKEIWINHYSSCHKILLVGEGDFSFSNSLAVAFGSATNMIATSLNSKGYLSGNYGKAMSNIENLKIRGCIVLHEVDATKMADHLLLKSMTFDRIVYNFPHAGFFQNESRKSQLGRHQRLVGLFLSNAKKMISGKGEIHISHKSNGFFREWNLALLALVNGLRLVEEVHFNFTDYPGYRTKYGYGGDKNFNCNPSKTYKFVLII